jgi:hypothetical protein
MSKEKNPELERMFVDWLEKQSDSADLESNKEQLQQDEIWLHRMQTANYIAHQADVIGTEKVPHWDRTAAFESDKRPWWQWQGLPAMSLAFSFFAIALVLFKVEIVMQEEGMLLSFSGSQTINQDNKVAALVEQKLQQFASEQQIVLANYAADIKVKQQDNNLQLASYIIGASRQERKEDFSEFINYVNDQRDDDRFNQSIKFKQLEQDVLFQKANFEQSGLTVKPANWITED